MINTRFIWYLEKTWHTEQKPVCVQEAPQHHEPHSKSWKVRLWCLCMVAVSGRSLLWFRKGLWQHWVSKGFICDLHRIWLRGRLLVFLSEYLRDRRIGNTLSDEFYSEEGVPTGGVLACIVCSTPLLAPRIGLYTASLVSLKDALIGWSASDYDAPIQLWRIQINTGYTLPSPTWRTSPTWRKQKAFPLPGTAALWVF